MKTLTTLIATLGFAAIANAGVSACPAVNFGTYFCTDKATGQMTSMDVMETTDGSTPAISFHSHDDSNSDVSLNCVTQAVTTAVCTAKDRQDTQTAQSCDAAFGVNNEAIFVMNLQSSAAGMAGSMDINTGPLSGSPATFFAHMDGKLDSITPTSFHAVLNTNSVQDKAAHFDGICNKGQN